MPQRHPQDRHGAERLRLLGAAIRTGRQARGYSQEGFAAACGLHRTYIGAVERGEVNLTVLNLYRVADTLEVDASELLP